MASVINTNISSLNAQHNLTKSGATLQTALERLSSGLRINSAKDDAAGLAISERMTAQINGLNQATRNANDGISLTQTAESAIAGMTDNLQRLRELAVQAANSTNSASDRASIQSEVSQLVSEIGRISGTTEFNGIKLLDGSFNGKTFQVGANANQTIAVAIESTSTNKLGSSLTSSLTAVNNGTAMAAGDLVLNGVAIGSSVATSDNASTAGGAISAISKAAAINLLTGQTGVTAKVDTTTAVGASQALGGGIGKVTINGVDTTNVTLSGVDATADRTALVQAINAKSSLTGVTATDTGLSATGIQLSAADGRNIVTSLTQVAGSVGGSSIFTSASTGIKETTSYGNFTLSSSKAIAVTGSSSIANAGVVAGTYSTQTAAASTAAGSSTAFVSGDFKINGAVIGASLAASDTASTAGQANSAIAKAAAINAISGFSGVTATVNVNQLNGFTQTATADTGTITINGVATATITTSTDATANRTAVISAINAISGRTGVTAVDGGTAALGVHLIAADGRNIVSTHATFTASSNTGVSGSAAAYGTFTLSSDKKFTVSGGDTGASMSTIAMLAVGTYGSGQTGQSLNSLNVTTVDGANNAVSAIDNAINTLNSVRGDLGALQNRFTSTVSNLSSSSDNLNAARSRIRDADFAVETAKLSRGQILQQAGVAMLAQANALPNNVLALLK
jgi:flagellin